MSVKRKKLRPRATKSAPPTADGQRRLEIDLLRTIAIAAMILYHLLYDLEMFYGYGIGIFSSFWDTFGTQTASLFLLLVGVSFHLSWQRTSGAFTVRYKKYAARGFRILTWGVLVSLVTFLFDPETYVRFGILHLIGVSAFLLPLFAPMRTWSAAIGLIILGLGSLDTNIVNSSFLLPLGIGIPAFRSVDYYPLLPWFGFCLLGLAVANICYGKKISSTKMAKHPLLRVLSLPGKYSLGIYLFHQPILLLLLWLLLGEAPLR